MPHIYYLPDEEYVVVEEGETILEASLEAGIGHTHVCGGSARCSTCRVLIIDGLDNCSDRTSAEKAISDRLRFDPAVRLACQTQVFGDMRLRRLAVDADDLEHIQDQMAGQVLPDSIGKEKRISILFADIRGFTPFAEKLLPYDVIYVLNRYFRRMGAIVSRYDGTINNYMGDGLMALFGLENSEEAAERAVRAGVEMIEAMEKLNPHLETLYHQRLQIGIGIHYGGVVIGKVGAADNQRLTAIGDAVNLASRIEAANKQVGTNLLISEEVYAHVKEQVIINKRVSVQLPGKSGEYPLYEVVGMHSPCVREEISPTQRKTSLAQTFFKAFKQFLVFCKKMLGKIWH